MLIHLLQFQNPNRRLEAYMSGTCPSDLTLSLFALERKKGVQLLRRESPTTSVRVWKASRCLTRSLSHSSRLLRCNYSVLCLVLHKRFHTFVYFSFSIQHSFPSLCFSSLFLVGLAGFCPSFRVYRTPARSLEHLWRFFAHFGAKTTFFDDDSELRQPLMAIWGSG